MGGRERLADAVASAVGEYAGELGVRTPEAAARKCAGLLADAVEWGESCAWKSPEGCVVRFLDDGSTVIYQTSPYVGIQYQRVDAGRAVFEFEGAAACEEAVRMASEALASIAGDGRRGEPASWSGDVLGARLSVASADVSGLTVAYAVAEMGGRRAAWCLTQSPDPSCNLTEGPFPAFAPVGRLNVLHAALSASWRPAGGGVDVRRVRKASRAVVSKAMAGMSGDGAGRGSCDLETAAGGAYALERLRGEVARWAS